ncbi:MAG: serine hydrolase domain-containing protein [Pseudomonadota bacterium]
MTQNSDLAHKAFEPVAEALQSGQLPGAALGVVDESGDRQVLFGGSATLVPEPEPEPLKRETYFDLASLTKVMATTTAVMSLVESGAIELDKPISDYLPDMNQVQTEAPARSCSVRSLLSHQSGLPAWAPLYTLGSSPATLKAYVLQHLWTLGTPVYSDINFILLGILVERLANLGIPDAIDGPGLSIGAPSRHCAATEHCTWRERLIRGEVHDENAYALGGFAGHAGLFGTIDGVLDFAHRLMTGAILSAAVLTEMRKPVSAERALGWQVAHEGWSGGSTCSRETIGHTGFTGTGLWIDWENGRAWALLTNRVHPSRHQKTPIVELRKAVGDIMGMAS